MTKKILLYLLSFSSLLFSQPKEETRAVWVTTVFNLDWPTTSGPSAQKNEMIALLNLLKDARFNTIMLQVRARGDLLYPSAIEPYAKSLTGTLGGNPGYDALQFTIEEAHKRGMEVHAWWNVYKVYGTGTPPTTNPPHIVNRRRDLCKLYADEWWLDPGFPDTKTYLLNLAMEMVRNYDIDGIHFDFIRYPNPDFLDDSTYALYGGGLSKSDWRRNNINQFVFALYDSVQAVRPNVKVGSAPIGIYKDLSACNSGWDGYTQIFQDSRRWLLARKHDYLSPQIYWDINTCPKFDSLSYDWIINRSQRHIYAGIATYRMGTNDGNWPASEILAQVDLTRQYGGQGQTYYRTRSFKDNQKNILSLIKANQYAYPANIPSMSWKDNVLPNAPTDFTLQTSDSINLILSWTKPTLASDGDSAYYYNVYMDTIPQIDFTNIKNVKQFGVMNQTSVNVNLNSFPAQNLYFAVTAYDRLRNESLPSNVASLIVSSIDDELIAKGFTLYQNYPNPFNPETVISYQLSAFSNVVLKVYDVLGNEVATLVDEYRPAGVYEVKFNASHLSSGLYFYQLRTGDYIQTRKMLVMK